MMLELIRLCLLNAGFVNLCNLFLYTLKDIENLRELG